MGDELRLVELQQGTDEWHAWRETRRMASEAPIIMGCAPSYWEARTWDQLRERHAGFAEAPSERTKALWAAGHAGEEMARGRINDHTPAAFVPVCSERGCYGASLDGLDQRSGLWLEVKTVQSVKSPLLAKVRDRLSLLENAPHVYWQLVHQAGVLEGLATHGRLAVVHQGAIAEDFTFAADDLLADWPALQAEWDRFDAGEPQVHVPAGWVAAEGVWLARRAEHDAAKQRLAAARAALVALAGDAEKIETRRVRLARIEAAGRVDYRAALEELAVEHGVSESAVAELLERHRGKTRTDVRVSAV